MIDLNSLGNFDQIGALAEQLLTGTGEGKALFGGLFDTLRSEENAAELAVPDRRDIGDQLRTLERRARQSMCKRLEQHRSRLEDLASRPVMKSPRGFVDQRREDLDRAARDLLAAEERILSGKKQEYIRLASALEAMSPLKVLSRGFSVVTDERGAVLRDPMAVAEGDAVHIRMERGALDCRVEHRTGENK